MPLFLTDDLCENLKDVLEQTANLEAEYSKLKLLPDAHSNHGAAQSDTNNDAVRDADDKEEMAANIGDTPQSSLNDRQQLSTCDENTDCCGGTCQSDQLATQDAQKGYSLNEGVKEGSSNSFTKAVDQIRQRLEQLEKEYNSLTSTLTVK